MKTATLQFFCVSTISNITYKPNDTTAAFSAARAKPTCLLGGFAKKRGLDI